MKFSVRSKEILLLSRYYILVVQTKLMLILLKEICILKRKRQKSIDLFFFKECNVMFIVTKAMIVCIQLLNPLVPKN